MAESGTRSRNENGGMGSEPGQVNQLSCDMCDKKFRNPNLLLTHLRNHVAEEKNPSIRAIANTILKSIAAKLAPERVDTGRGPESRAAPPPSTTRVKRVKVETRDAQEQDERTKCDSSEHIIKNCDPNKPKKQYKCKICQKSSKDEAGLRRHERVHTGEKPYQCVYCKKFFAYKHNMRQHERQHTGERPYKCPFCEKAYTSASSLKWHLKSNVHRHILLN